MAVALWDAVKFNYAFQGALQGAGTPNQAGLGAFIPLHAGSNSVAFMDILMNANFNDYGNYNSIIHCKRCWHHMLPTYLGGRPTVLT